MAHYKNYQEYLSSPEWRARAQERLKIDGYKCQMCGSSGTMQNGLEVHHLSYRSIYREDVYTDLVCLCASCHSMIHRMMNRQTSADGRHGWKTDLSYAEHEPSDSWVCISHRG